MPAEPCLSGQQFANFILTQLPVYSKEILRDVRPTDGLIAHIDKGQYDAFAGVQQTIDRFNNVKANTAKVWQSVSETSCTGLPCDPPAYEIGMGTTRRTFGQERQRWKSQLFCFDQIISATKAVEHFEQYISEILMPATVEVGSDWVRRKALEMTDSQNKILANAAMSNFTWTWNTVGDEQVTATPSAWPTSKLTPEMLKRRVQPLRDVGYFGKWTNDPFWGGYDNFLELITDDDTCWELDKVASNTRVSDLWRFQMWQAAHEYYAYGMGGQIGNYMTHVDPNCLRFNKNGNTAVLVPRYYNTPATVGIKSVRNPDYDKAQYQLSFIWHRFAWQMLVAQLEQINAKMPFLVRGLNGEWQFATNDLGQDCNGNAISNFAGNKGFFFSDFRYAAKPRNTEWLTTFFHKREPAVVYEIDTCAADPGYPAQKYGSSPSLSEDPTYPCGGVLTWTPDKADNGHYKLAVSSTTCNDVPLDNDAIDSATLSALVSDLTSDTALGALGTWSTDGRLLILSDAACSVGVGANVVLPWLST